MTPARFERATYGLGNRCSIHLSYGALNEAVYLRRGLGGVNRRRPVAGGGTGPRRVGRAGAAICAPRCRQVCCEVNRAAGP